MGQAVGRCKEDGAPARVADRRLAARLQAGDESALADAYQRYAGLVFGVARSVLRDGAMAEEVTQEVFIFLWEHPDRFDPARGTMRSWLGLLAHRRSVDRVRAEVRRSRTETRVERAGAGDAGAGRGRRRAHPDVGGGLRPRRPRPASAASSATPSSSRTSGAAPTARSPSSWPSPRAPPSRGCASGSPSWAISSAPRLTDQEAGMDLTRSELLDIGLDALEAADVPAGLGDAGPRRRVGAAPARAPTRVGRRRRSS